MGSNRWLSSGTTGTALPIAVYNHSQRPDMETINSPCNAENLAYLAGAVHDGCLVKRTSVTRYDIQFYQKNREWLEKSICPRLTSLGIETPIRGPWKSCFYLKFGHKALYKTLAILVDVVPEGTKERNAFIRGFWDAEGSCPHVEQYLLGRRRRKKIPPQIGFHQNGSDRLLQDVRGALIASGIACSNMSGPLYRPVNKKPEFRFFIYGVGRIKAFFNLIQPEHPDKRKRLLLLFEHMSPANRTL